MVAACLTLAAALVATGAAAVELGAQFEGAVWSKYLFRGVPYTDGWVAQPALTLSLAGEWSVTTWMNVDLDDANRVAGRPTETDVTLRWAPADAGLLQPYLGLATYVVSLPREAASTSAELVAGLRGEPPEEGLARWLPALEVSLWYEVLEYDDLFVELAADRVIPLGGGAELTVRVTAGWAGGDYHEYFFGTDHAGWSDASFTAELGRSLGARWRVALMTQYQTLLSHSIRSASRTRHGEADWWLRARRCRLSSRAAGRSGPVGARQGGQNGMNHMLRLAAAGAALAAHARAATVAVPRMEAPVLTNADVLVVGGSLAAVAAAVDARRSGASVFLVTPWSYLGDDLCSTLRIWREGADEPEHPWLREMFPDEPERTAGRRWPFRYRADREDDPRHRDTTPPGRLTDGRDRSAANDSVQYNGPVTITADLGEPRPIGRVVLSVYQRPADFAVAGIRVSVSADGQSWSAPVAARNARTDLPAEEASLPIEAELSATQRYVRVEVEPAADAGRVLLAELAIEAPAPPAETAPPRARVSRPLRIQRTLDNALIAAEVPFLFASHPFDVLVAEDGRPAGLVIANRSGLQAIRARVIVDATPNAIVARMAGAAFEPMPPGPREFRRVVIGGEPVRSGIAAPVRHAPPIFARAEDGSRLPLIEYRLVMPFADVGWAVRAEAEQDARDATWSPDLRDASETLFEVAPPPIVARAAAAGPWPGAARLPLDAARPAGIEQVWVLSPRMAVDRAALPAMLHPDEWLRVGERIGRAAAEEARRTPPAGRARLRSRDKTVQPQAPRVRFVPPDTNPRWAGLERIELDEHAREVAAEYDVIIVGGGTGGAPAGIGAARQDARTLVIESLYGLGGVGTWGQIAAYYHGYRQGFTAEIDAGVAALSGQTQPAHRWNVEHKSEWLRRELRRAGADIWFGCLGIAALVEGDRMCGVVVATPEGPLVVRARCVVDATGNADVAAAAGAPCVWSDEAEVAVQGTGLSPRSLSRHYINTDYTFVDDTDVVDIWRAFIVGRELFAEAWDLARLIDTRERRRILGEVEISPLDLYLGRTWRDTIALAQSNFDTHGYTVHSIFALRPPDRSSITVPVPLRALLPRGVERLLVIGLGISAHRDALPVLRMQPDIQNHGYAAGVAAAWAAREDRPLRALDVRALQRHLLEKGIVPETALSDDDTPPVPDERLDWAVRALPEDWTGLEVVLSDTNRALPRLRAAWAAATNDEARLTYAMTLGMLGDPTGAPTLAAAVRARGWADGWEFRAAGQFGPSLAPLDAMMIALGRTRSPEALEPLLEKARALDPTVAFSHHRAVALALESLGDPRAAPVLAEVLRRPGMSGHWVTTAAEAKARRFSGGTDTRVRRDALREIALARALYRCGDHEGLGRSILERYADDLHGHYARHARAVLGRAPPAPPRY